MLLNLLGLAAGLIGFPTAPGNPPAATPAEPARWSAEYTYPGRPALVAAAAADSARLVDQIRVLSAAWWPAPG
jgi:hypothetical protein